MQRLATYLQLADPSFDAVMKWVLGLREEFNVPHTLQEAGIDDKRFDQLAAMAVVDPTAAGNPVELTEANCKQLFTDSYSGKL
jgi:alcohol dehydrogenase class IV